MIATLVAHVKGDGGATLRNSLSSDSDTVKKKTYKKFTKDSIDTFNSLSC